MVQQDGLITQYALQNEMARDSDIDHKLLAIMMNITAISHDQQSEHENFVPFIL